MDGSFSFGAWLRRRRKALDLTQAELARHAGCVVGTIKSIEGDARRPSRLLSERLAASLNLGPDECAVFIDVARGLLGTDQLPELNGRGTSKGTDTGHTPRQSLQRQSLPASPNVLIGREAELTELHTMLTNPACRLITIVGPGGIGKTRLALTAAERAAVAMCFADGAVFVPLAAVSDARLVAPAILTALGVMVHGQRDPGAQLRDVLRERALLLVLDNLEQLLSASGEYGESVTGLLADVLQHAPRVTHLVTSRERLGVPGEWTYDLTGLDCPADGPIANLQHSSAAQLFVQRARQARRQFALTDDDARAVAQICRLVEGMPLAIELAAAGLRVRSCTAIASAIGSNPMALQNELRSIPERHRSVWAAFEHSWQLLTNEERHVFARLSVFRGGFDEQAAAEIAQASLQLLAALLNKSLLRWDGASYYDMHELLRQFAAEKLMEMGEAEHVNNQHLTHYRHLAEQAGSGLYGPQQRMWCERLERELDNLRAALAWSVQHDIESGLRLAGELDRYWLIYRPLREGIDWLTQLLRHAGAGASSTAQAKALLALSLLLDSTGAFVEAHALAEQGLALYQRLEDEIGVIRASFLVGLTIDSQDGPSDVSMPYVRESLARANALGDTRGRAEALAWLGGAIYHQTKDYAQACAMYEASLSLLRELGDLTGMTLQLSELAQLAVRERDFARAHACLHEAESLHMRLRIAGDMANLHFAGGLLALREARYVQAQQALEASLSLDQAHAGGTNPWAVLFLSVVLLRQGDLARASALLVEAVECFREETSPSSGLTFALEGVASLAIRRGQHERAVRLYAWADAIREAVGNPRPRDEQDDVDNDFVTVRAQLDEHALAILQEAGRTMPRAQAIAEALAIAAETQPNGGEIAPWRGVSASIFT